MNALETQISNLDVIFHDANNINEIKEHLAAQESHARNAGWSREDLETLIMSENDVTDVYGITNETMLDTIRDIQHGIIGIYAV